MTLIDWVPVLTASVLWPLVIWLFRSLIITRLRESVAYEFNEKLEEIRSDLRAKEAELDALRNGALAGLVGRQSKLYERRLSAVDDLWNSVIELSKVKFVSAVMRNIDFEKAAKQAVHDENTRKLFQSMGGSVELKDLDLVAASRARPYITPLAWAYYSAYQAIILNDLMKRDALRLGVEDPAKLINSERAKELAKIALPHRADELERKGDGSHFDSLNEIEELILSESSKIIRGVDSDKDNSKQAAAIIAEVNRIQESRPEAINL